MRAHEPLVCMKLWNYEIFDARNGPRSSGIEKINPSIAQLDLPLIADPQASTDGAAARVSAGRKKEREREREREQFSSQAGRPNARRDLPSLDLVI